MGSFQRDGNRRWLTLEEVKNQTISKRCRFWDGASDHLDRLGNRISAEERKKIEAAIAKKIRQPTTEEYKQAARDCVASWGWKYASEHHPKYWATLADEQEKWKQHTDTAASRIGAILSGAKPCRYCSKPGEGLRGIGIADAGKKPEPLYVCSGCLIEALNLYEKSRSAAKAPLTPDLVHHEAGDFSHPVENPAGTGPESVPGT